LVDHSAKEFASGDMHNNTAESFNPLLQQAKQGIFQYMSQKHLPRYLNEIGFRWVHRVPKKIITKNRRYKTVRVALPVIDMLCFLLPHAVGDQLRRTPIAVFESQLQTLPVANNPFFDHSFEIQLSQISDTRGTTTNTERR
jgi:hypothetical protein